MNQLSLNTAIVQFAFSGVLAPHKREMEPARVSPTPPSPKKK